MSQSQNPAETSTDHEQPTPTAHKLGMSRRDLLRRSAVGGATLAGVSTGAIRLDHGPVQESQAIAPAVAAAGLASAAGVSLGWSLRDSDPLGADVPEGETSDSLHNSAYNTAQTRLSTNQSTIIDNRNIIESGSRHAAFGDGKLEAIESLNDQNTEQEVLDDGRDAAADYLTTLQKNYLKSWNETVNELETLFQTVDDHPDLSQSDVIQVRAYGGGDSYTGDLHRDYLTVENIEYELPDGTNFDIKRLSADGNFDGQYTDVTYSPLGASLSRDPYSEWAFQIHPPGDGDPIEYMDSSDWRGPFQTNQDIDSDVHGELEVWVTGVYDDVQSGDLDTAELLTPREQAQLTAEDEDFPQAIADLQALNVAVDLEREAEIYLPEIDATLYGQLAYNADGSLSTGEYDASEMSESVYLTYDVSQGQGDWSAYDEGIDGGILTFTQEPFDQTLFVVDTTAGETVELTADDFEESDEEDEWTVDLSDDLEDAITNVDQIQFFSEVSETQFETIQLQDEFEIITFSDSDGEEYDEADFERSEPHSDDNYITEEEWQEQQERHEELIQKYEDAQGGGISIPGVEDVLDGEANGLIGIAVVGMVLVSAILSALNPLS